MQSRPLIVALALGFAVAGCAQSQDAVDGVQNALHNFNPFGSNKKPLPGERKALFPEGVPGVQQGVPPELTRGNQPQPGQEPLVADKPAAEKPAAQAAKPRTRRVRTTAAPPAEPRPQRTRRAAPRPNDPPADGVWPPPQASRQTPAAPAPAAPPAAAQSQGGWQPPAAQPVPTIWPDPPKAQ